MVYARIKHSVVKDITVKIGSVEPSFKEAVCFLGGISAGITNEDDLKTAVWKKCPFYYKLYDIMSDQASVYLDADNNEEGIYISWR